MLLYDRKMFLQLDSVTLSLFISRLLYWDSRY